MIYKNKLDILKDLSIIFDKKLNSESTLILSDILIIVSFDNSFSISYNSYDWTPGKDVEFTCFIDNNKFICYHWGLLISDRFLEIFNDLVAPYLRNYIRDLKLSSLV